MKRIFYSIVIAGVIALALFSGFKIKDERLSSADVSVKEVVTKKQKAKQYADVSRVEAASTPSDRVPAPWDNYSPLSEAERESFALVKTQIQKFNTWGKVEDAAIPAFRNVLFQMGDRAIAETARTLATVSKGQIKDKSDAEDAIRLVDELSYFARSNLPLAHDSIRTLALRPVSWDEKGNLENPLEATITFEMFDLLARDHPEEAIAHIKLIEKRGRPGYFAHFSYGRKLSGKTNDQIDQELRAAFGSPELALK